jgi:hypothetical protein
MAMKQCSINSQVLQASTENSSIAIENILSHIHYNFQRSNDFLCQHVQQKKE